MNPRLLLGIAVMILLGVGGVIGFLEYQKRNKPAPVNVPQPIIDTEPPPPPDPKELARQEAAKDFQALSEQIGKDPDRGELYLKRAQAIYKAEEAIPQTPEQRALIAIGDIFTAVKMNILTAEVYGEMVKNWLWVDQLRFQRAEKDDWRAKVLIALDLACAGGKPAHRARLHYIDLRMKRDFKPEEGPMRERELESLDALITANEATADDAERAGDLAVEAKKLNKAVVYYRKAAQLDPKRREKVDAKTPK